MSFKFEKLSIWAKALDMSCQIHQLTRGFPKDELFVLTSQLKRAADSVSLNIAEGSTGQSNAEQARFIGYAQRSALEVVNGLYVAKSRFYLSEEEFRKHYNQLEALIKMIQAFKRALLNKHFNQLSSGS